MSHRKSKTRTTDKKSSETERPPECIGIFALDSGAHSLYTKLVMKSDKFRLTGQRDYSAYDTAEFWDYVERYANFVKENKKGIDYYINVDVIFNPERTWQVQKYLEDEHGLNPMPVIHWGTPLEWVKRYVKEGYEVIGLGGLGQEATKDLYYDWADKVYHYLCPKSNDRKPIVKTHGFAMTAYDLLIRYPWFSVDSASWCKAGGYGMIYIPRMRNGEFVFWYMKDGIRQPVYPYNISVSTDSPNRKVANRSLHTISKSAQRIVHKWIDKIGIPLGSVDKDGEMKEWGVVSTHSARKIANLKFFEAMCNSLPEWPWPFRGSPRRSFLESV